MTEERFWELAEEGSRHLLLTMQWLLLWPLILLGLLVTRRDSDGTATAALCEDIAVQKDCQARAEGIVQSPAQTPSDKIEGRG